MSYFPVRSYDNAGDFARAYFEEIARAASSLDWEALTRAAAILAACVGRGGYIYTCGNGGSAAVANHLVCDCLKGARTGSTVRPKVSSLSCNVDLITALVNDMDPREVFSYQLESLGTIDDVLITISSSGASPNIIRAIEVAKEKKMAVIAMTGFGGGLSRTLADVSLHVEMTNYGVVEDVHQSLMHILAQHIRLSHLSDPAKLGSIKF